MRGQLLRGLAEAASVAASLTKIAVEASRSGSASAGASAQRSTAAASKTVRSTPRPWSTQRPAQAEQQQQRYEDASLEQDVAVEQHELIDESISSSNARRNIFSGEPVQMRTVTPEPTPEPVPVVPPPASLVQEKQVQSAPAPALAPSPPSAPESELRVESSPSPAAATPAPEPAPPRPKLAPKPVTVAEVPPAPPLSPSEPKPSVAPSPSTTSASADADADAVAKADEYDPENIPRAAPLRAAKVPSSRLGRLMHYGSLGAGLAWGAAGSFLSGGGAGSSGGNAFIGEANLRRLVDKLSTMRGAALKMGQFMSIQDSNMLPPELEEVLLRVQNSANYMPEWQMEKVMTEDLGPDWRSHFDQFSPIPFAAASIGQVHSAILSSSHPSPLAGQKVAVKIQFPGIKQSIASDLSYLSTLLTASALLPKGLFLESTIKTMRGELEDECDYEREAEMGRRFARLLEAAAPSSIEGVMQFCVPRVVDELCTGRVLTTEMMKGRPLTQASRYDQERRNRIATSILRLCLQELFHFRLMQTDPNWSNFLLNERTNELELLDFGATREYSAEFIEQWFALLSAAVRGDRESCLEWSHRIGYLTGAESEGMLEAHLSSMLLLAEPFSASSPSPYAFTNQTITARVRSHIPLMLRERKTPPPKETYSLNRKLSGAFLLCARLGADVRCREVWEEVAGSYKPLSALRSGSPASGWSAAGARGFHTTAAASASAPFPSASAARSMDSSRPSSMLAGAKTRRRFDGLAQAPHGRASSSSSLTGAGSGQGAGAGALEGGFATAADDDDGPPARRLDLRSEWSRQHQQRLGLERQQRSHRSSTLDEGLAQLEIPRDPVGVESSSSHTAPVVSGKGAAEARMKIALGQEEGPAAAATTTTAVQEEEEVVVAAGGAGPKPVLIRDVLVPRKPPPPGPEDCCMSGCAHCTYDVYADAIQEYIAELGRARDALVGLVPALGEGEWAEAEALGIKRPSASSGGPAQPRGGRSGGGGGGANDEAEAEAEREVDEAVRAVEDPTLRAFLDMERRMKKKAREREREREMRRA
ncbi:hypothetical protein OC844_006021 [Tilletia horrida]|nr:hypothetical protein OC844_006021 [Tilletia horrida]